MTVPKKKASATAEVDADALYDRLEGVPHRESVEAEVDRALAPLRAELIDGVMDRFGHLDAQAAKKRAKEEEESS